MGALTKVRWQGPQGVQYVTERHLQHILARERILQWLRYSTTIYQGSFNYGVKASAGTHDGADCIDCISNPTALRISRILGSARFKRTVKQGFSMGHDHEVLDYSGGAAQIAKNQLVSYHGRRNGLAGNGPDTDYKMLVFPKFIYNGYIGYVRAKVDTAAYEQQTKSSSKLNAIETGLITLVVCETEVAGKRWYVTLSGKCILASEFSKVKYSFVKKQRTYVVKKGAWRRKYPNGSAPKVGTRAMRAGEPFEGAGRATVDDVVWITDKNGNGLPLSRLSLPSTGGGTPAKPAPVTPPPAPAAPAPAPVVRPSSHTVRIGTRNVSRWRIGTSVRQARLKQLKVWTDGKPWETRVKMIAKDAQAAHLGILGTQEQGQTKDAVLLAATLGKNWDSVLHGDDAGDITQGNLWDEKLYKRMREGKFFTVDGATHDNVTWTQFVARDTDEEFFVANMHTYHKAPGKSAKGNVNDHLRHAIVQVAVVKMEEIAKGKPVFYIGDFNSAKSNPYDGPGKAFAAAGIVDIEGYAKTKHNEDLNSAHPLNGPSPKTGRQIDRIFVKKSFLESGKIIIARWSVTASVATKPGSDHYQVDAEIIIRTGK